MFIGLAHIAMLFLAASALWFCFGQHFLYSVLVLYTLVLLALLIHIAGYFYINSSQKNQSVNLIIDNFCFGITPSLVIYFAVLQEQFDLGWLAPAIYMLLFVVRTNRVTKDNLALIHSVQTSKSVKGHNLEYTKGLSGISATGLICAIIGLNIKYEFSSSLFPFLVISCLLCLAILMISNIRYLTPISLLQLLRLNQRYLLFVLTILAITLFPEETLFIGFFCYVFFAPLSIITQPSSMTLQQLFNNNDSDFDDDSGKHK